MKMWSKVGRRTIMFCQVVILLVVSFCSQEGTHGVSLQEDLTLTSNQKQILDRFRTAVESQLPRDYMKQDIYLVRWLRARNFDIDLARAMLLENLEWRRKNKMDRIHDEDWSDFTRRYKFWVEGKDKEGRPIAFFNIGSWDLRHGIITGQREKMTRYLYRNIDFVVNKLRELQAEGKGVSQVNLIVNLAGYSVTQQGCLQCIPYYVEFVSVYELRYPGIAHKIILVNTPGVFEGVLSAVRPILSPRTREALKIFGTNRREYGPVLFREIEKDQLPRDVGGTDDGKIYGDSDDINDVNY